MTHPIPGADSERAACPFCKSTTAPRLGTNVELGCNEDTEFFGYTVYCDASPASGGCGANCGFHENEHEAMAAWNRAAAKVGANVAAESVTADKEFHHLAHNYRRFGKQADFDALAKFIDASIAAGAPAETPKPDELTADLINLLNAIRPNFGAVGSRDVDVAAQRRRIDSAIVQLGMIMAHDGREHPTPRPDAAQPAPIAGDVEKDAAAVRSKILHVLLERATSIGEDHAFYKRAPGDTRRPVSMLAESLVAAMLANSSSGEAG